MPNRWRSPATPQGLRSLINLLAKPRSSRYVQLRTEKRKPHCPLPVVHALVDEGKVRATETALVGAAAMDLAFDDMLDVIRALTIKDFHKSMTTHADHRVWQDVYQPGTAAGDVYLKLTVIDDVLIVSFKEL